MSKNIKKFEEYNPEPLMNDLGEIEVEDEKDFNPKEWELEKIIDVLTEDPTESEDKKLSDSLVDLDEAITFDTTVPKDIKRGDHIWITALIKKKGSSSFNDPGKQAVLKVRVVDIFYGLSHLQKVFNK